MSEAERIKALKEGKLAEYYSRFIDIKISKEIAKKKISKLDELYKQRREITKKQGFYREQLKKLSGEMIKVSQKIKVLMDDV